MMLFPEPKLYLVFILNTLNVQPLSKVYNYFQLCWWSQIPRTTPRKTFFCSWITKTFVNPGTLAALAFPEAKSPTKRSWNSGGSLGTGALALAAKMWAGSCGVSRGLFNGGSCVVNLVEGHQKNVGGWSGVVLHRSDVVKAVILDDHELQSSYVDDIA